MNTNSSAEVHPLAAADTFWVMGDQVRKRGKLEGTAFNVIDVIVPSGSGTPPHTHASPEIFRILEGTVRIWSMAGGKPVETNAAAGDVVTIPAHAPHAYQNVGPVQAIMMAIVDDDMIAFFEAAASNEAPKGPPTPEAIGRIMSLTASHGIKILQAA
ncbi:cupin domain-containing protein [Rhizobium mesosinicum]|uniref:Cupin domain-containing protein n=1 Tax=Rhizobium mesosinicum TaxID=335017 RepID=A0ABS7GVG9_9HYPH|nr:cupin domain-containing protein [Rhizobium mesosinicum]MBW9053939.1 cupin domain-containing protein [Rhizobium mesosinicum]